MFAETLREHGVEVFFAEKLFADVLGTPGGTGLGVPAHAQRADGRAGARPVAPERLATTAPATMADILIGGIASQDCRPARACSTSPAIRRTCWCRRCRTSSSSVTRRAGSTAASR